LNRLREDFDHALAQLIAGELDIPARHLQSIAILVESANRATRAGSGSTWLHLETAGFRITKVPSVTWREEEKSNL
jgi:hypothetical protein